MAQFSLSPGLMQASDGGGDFDTKTLVDAVTKQQVAAGVKSTDKSARIGNETATEANARITQGYKDQAKPDLTVEGAEAGATINFVRTAAGGVGEYKEVFPMGAAIPSSRTTTSGNVYDQQGNLISGSGLKTPTSSSASTSTTLKTNNGLPEGFTAGPFPKGLEQYFGSSAGVLGYRITTNPDGTQQLEVSDSPGSTKTFGARFTQSAPGVFTPAATGTNTLVSNTSGTLTSSSGTTTATGPTLASDVFKQTLAIFFGASEMAKPWVNELYNVVSKFYKQGATSEEAFNMAVLDSEKNPALADFTKRFKGIYSLQKMKQAGQAVTVPTIAEYFATESKMGDVLKQSNLGDLANEDFLGDVLAKGVSATEFANRITAIFDRIDNAPKDIKDTLSRFFPTIDRISLAKAIALGDKGAKELQNQVAGYEVLSAAEKQGLGANQIAGGTTAETAYQYALGGETYDTALTKFGTVAAMLPTVNKLTQVYGEPMLGPSGIQEAVFGKSAKQIKTLEDLVKKEEATFSAKSGVSQISLASQRRAAGLI